MTADDPNLDTTVRRHLRSGIALAKRANGQAEAGLKALADGHYSHATNVLGSAQALALASIAQSLAVLAADVADQRGQGGTA